MFSTVWFLARKDVQYMLRTKETLFWTFLMPVVFFFFIGTITGGFDGGNGDTEKDPLVVEVDPRAGFLASNLEQRLSEVGFRVLSVSQVPEDSRVSRLRIPAAFSDSVLAGKKTRITLVQSSSGMGEDYDKFRIQRAVFTLLGDMVAVSQGGKPPTEESLSIITQAPKTLDLEVTKAGLRRERIPTGFEQAIPGTMVMFTLLVLLTSGSILLVIERKERLLQRLGAAPLGRPTVILGKWGGRVLMGLIQLGFAMLIGTLLFGMRWGPNLPMLVVVLLFYAGLVALLGMLLGNLARTEGQAVGIGVLASNILAALGGCWWPIEITPGWMQKLALALPTGWTMDALHKLVNFGAPSTSVIPHLITIAVAALAVGWLVTRTFRFQ